MLYDCSATAPALRGAARPAAPGQRCAGDWIFASGLLPTRFGSAAGSLSGEPGWTIQFRSLWERAQAVLAAGGTDLTHTMLQDVSVNTERHLPCLPLLVHATEMWPESASNRDKWSGNRR